MKKTKLLSILNTTTWISMFIAIATMLYSFTQPSIGQMLTLVSLGIIGVSFGLNSWYKKVKQEIEDQEEQ